MTVSKPSKGMGKEDMSVGRLDWPRLADRYLGPDYLFPLTLWLVVDRGSLSWRGLWLALGLTLLTLGPPKIGHRLLLQRGVLSPEGLRTRSGRFTFWAIGPILAGLLLPLLVLSLLFPERSLLVFYLALLAMTVVGSVCLFWLKVSGHAMASAALVAVTFFYAKAWGWVFLPLMLVICASRMALKVHTFLEVLVGALVGLTVPTLLFWFFPIG